MEKDIVVLGAGVVGLSTAVNIQSRIPGARVKVIAEHFYNETTSYGSGGILIPSAQTHAGTNFEKLRQWCGDSWKQYSSLATGPQAGTCGAIISTGYHLCNDNFEQCQNPLYKEFVFEHKQLSDKAMNDLGFKRLYKYGFKVTTVVLDQRKYLLWLQQRFEDNNGRFEKRRVTSLNEFVGKCDVLVNCCGLGSRHLLGDRLVFPVRGQVVRVKAPWIKHWVYTDDVTYMIPGFVILGVHLSEVRHYSDIALLSHGVARQRQKEGKICVGILVRFNIGETYVTLGGVQQSGNESLDVDDKDTEDILQRCRDLIPSLKAAETDHSWVGLRPCRDFIRVEKETLEFRNGTLEVIHNYGHGSSGVAFSWGTALDAADHVNKSLSCHQEDINLSKL